MRRFGLTARVKGAAAALVVLWCVQPLVLTLHAGAHAHRYCAEHNAFEEGGEGLRADEAEEASSQAVPLLASGKAASLMATPSGGHRECTVAAAASPKVLCLSGRGLPAPILSAHGPPSRGALQASPPLHVLAFAPKASPPAALTPSAG